MLRLLCQIQITQQPTTDYPDRFEQFTFNFCHQVEIKSSWKEMTQTAKITLPRRLYFQTSSGDIVNWGAQPGGAKGNVIYADGAIAPIIARGDKVTIWLGYWWTTATGQLSYLPIAFEGFISKINPKVPLEIECEDMMYILKQALCPNMTFDAKKYNTETMLKYLIANPIINSSNTVYFNNTVLPYLKSIVVVDGVGESANVKTNVGNFQVKNESIAEVLQRLRKDYKIETFFRDHYFDANNNRVAGNALYCSGIVYYPSDYINSKGQIFSTLFDFQDNVISTDNLVYTRTDDIRLGIKAYSVNKVKATGTTADGATKTTNKRIEVTVGDRDGDIRTQFFWTNPNGTPITNTAQLQALALQRLSKLKYEGWSGRFLTFGLPQIKHGQAITFQDDVLPERNGTYLIKSVNTTFGVNGFRQDIEPHIRIDTGNYTINDFLNGI